MAKAPKIKPDQDTGPKKPDAAQGEGAAMATGADASAPATAAATTAPVANTEAKTKAKPKTVVVTGPAAGRWRAGRHFTAEPVSINETDLSEDELMALQGDPLLTVEIVDAPH